MSLKFKLLCNFIHLIERRYDGVNTHTSLTGFCNRLYQQEDKFVEMVEKIPVEAILYLMAAFVKLADDVEHGRRPMHKFVPLELINTHKIAKRAEIMDLIMDRMIEEKKEERERAQRLMQTQIAYATTWAQQNMPSMFDTNNGPQPSINNSNASARSGMEYQKNDPAPFPEYEYEYEKNNMDDVEQTYEYKPNTQPTPTPVKRKRGRPKGSKNKPKQNNEEKVKRKPGRPKGSKNKSKQINLNK